LKGVWNIWKRPLIASLEPGFIVDQYAWKIRIFRELQDEISPILNFNKICGTIYELYEKDNLWSYVNQALL
jgi:hypothetical protein